MSDGASTDRWVIKRNIARFRAMLEGEIAPDRRREIERLLADELGKLAAADKRGRRE
jgi:hypothetical protein